jgi:uncharacterized protein (TIGR02452 family)
MVQVYEDTKRKCLTGRYGPLKKGKSYLMKNLNPILEEISFEKKYEKTKIDVVNDDVLAVTKHYHDIGEKKIIVLNLASDKCPGGGVGSGAMAQEEELFRRSNYFMCLDSTFYPLSPASIVYTPNVTIVKDKDYADLLAPFTVSMLAAAAVRRPHLSKDGYYSDRDYSIMYHTIHNIFKIAYLYGYETLVLGALGCGAFYNPPEEVVKIYNIFLEKYNGCFKNIVFAVYSRSDDNFDIFSKHIFRG